MNRIRPRRKLTLLKHRGMKFMLTFVLIWVVISPALGSEFEVEVCEYEDAILLFPNTPVSSVGDVRAKTWNKDNNIRLATWVYGGKFVPLLSYEVRLMAIGENSIKIRNATRSDTGTYMVILTSGSSQVFIEYTSQLKVIVPPTNQCIPTITRDGNALVAVLPTDGCGIPNLTPKWMNTNQTMISGNISVLNVEPGRKTVTYTACAVGKSMSCYQGGADEICSNYTVSALQSQIQSILVSVEGIVSVIIFFVVIGVILFFVCWKWESIKSKLSPLIETNELHIHDVEIPLMTEETGAKDMPEVGRTVADETLLEQNIAPIIGVREIKKHLIDQYKSIKDVFLSPYHGENTVDVSQVYCELEIMYLGVQDIECIQKLEAANVTSPNFVSDNEIFSDINTENTRPIPALLLGECGSGKTTWCKNLVHQWCHYHIKKESNLEMTDSDIPDISRFEILLYIKLEKKLEDSSILEHVRTTLFPDCSDYYEHTMTYISEHGESVLILIDGLDEVACNLEPIVHLLEEKEIAPCSYVLTSRPNAFRYLQKKVGISLRLFQIHGISPEKSKEYASKVLKILCQRRGEKLNIDHFWKFARHMQVLSMCNNPFLCLSLILFWVKCKALSADITDVLLTIVEYYIRRAMTREWYKANINTVLNERDFDISIFIAKSRSIHYLREQSYLLKIISDVAEKLWSLQMQINVEESVDMERGTVCCGDDIELCLETGILIKTIREVFGRKRAHNAFSHTLLFHFFVALSIAMGKRESFQRYITTDNAVIINSNIIHMVCQFAPDIGNKIVTDIRTIYDKGNDDGTSETTEILDQQLICKIKRRKFSSRSGTPVKWLQTLMCTYELSNARLLILTEGLKFTKDITTFRLEFHENRNDLIVRLPILPKLQVLQIDINNCTLLLHEAEEWNRIKLSHLEQFVLKSVNVDVTTIGYIIEAISSCKVLRTLELCPKDDSNIAVVLPGSLKPFHCWGCLAQGIKDMTQLRRVRLHNLQIGEHLPALLNSLSSSPTMAILELMNLKEIGAGELLKLNASDQGVFSCIHHKATFEESNLKILQLIKNAMSEKSWLALTTQLEILSPHILHVEQVHQSGLVLKELLQGIGKCRNLNTLSICNIRVGNEHVAFSDLRSLQKLKKLMLCKIDMSDSSWKELSNILSTLAKLKEMSLACLEIQNGFIDVHKLLKVRLLTMKEVHLEEGLWSKLGDEVITLPKLKTLELVSCKMSLNESVLFQEKMNHSALHVEVAKTSETENSEILSVDMIVASKKQK